MTNNLQNAPNINLSSSCHEIAKQFATEQSSRAKVKQVYMNTLAVQAVKNFLECFQIETDLENSDSWNFILRRSNNIADLSIPNLGRVECRPILPGETSLKLPLEVTEERIAYVAVQFQEQLDEVELIGFYPALNQSTEITGISLENLQPIAEIIDYLWELETGLTVEEVEEVQKWSIFDRFQQEVMQITAQVKAEIDELTEQVGWLLADYQLSAQGTKSIKPKDINSKSTDENQPQTRDINSEVFKQKYLKLPLKIAGENYELRIIPHDISINKWRFELRNTKSGGKIPPGFKLRLLDENGAGFEDNETVAHEVVDSLAMEFEFESGEGIIWEIEPIPDLYRAEIIYF